MLCMVLVLSSATSAFADEPQNTDSQSQAEVVTEPVADEATGDEAAVNSSEQQQQEEQQQEQQQQEEQQQEQQQQEQQQPEEQQPETEAPTVEASAEQPAAEEAQPIQQLTYEDDNVKIHVSAKTEGIIPENASLKVVPLVKQDVTAGMTEKEVQSINEINAQYDVVEQKLNEKADEEEYDIGGFLAYDISFVDADGNKTEPNGDVKVTMKYKNAVLPETIEKENASDMDVTVMHLEEDAQGNVKQVVDMSQENNKIETIETTDTRLIVIQDSIPAILDKCKS